LYLSIYEHTTGSAVIKVSNITFVEMEEGACPFGEPCTCDVEITNAKALIEGTIFAGTQARASTEAQAKSAVEAIIGGLSLKGVTPTVVGSAFTAAIGGEAGNPGGTDGSYTFTVRLNRGLGVEQITSSLTLSITAMPLGGETLFTLADFLAKYPDLAAISTSTSSYNPLRTSSSTVSVTIDRPNGALDIVMGAESAGFNIMIGDTGSNLALKTVENVYEVRIAGSVASGYTPPAGASINLRYAGWDSTVFSVTDISAGDGTFDITGELPVMANPGSNTNDVVRIAPNAAGANMRIKITSIEVVFKGPRP
jgi:hypothetical protein